MDVRTFCPGMVFWANDDIINSSVNHHCYVVLGIAKQMGNLTRIQAMTITSMMDKEINLEVPIKMVNGQVSYIVPYTIFPIDPAKIDLRNYKGMLVDNECFKVSEFLQFLMGLYARTIGVVPNDDIIKAYYSYCKWFWNKNPGAKEYRDFKDPEFVQKKIEGLRQGSLYSDGSLGSKIILPDSILSSLSDGVQSDTPKETGTTPNIPKAYAKDRRPSVENPLIVVGKKPVKNKVEEPVAVSDETKKKETTPSKEKPSKLSKPTRKDTKDIKYFDTLPKNYVEWENTDLITFLQYVEKFGKGTILKRLTRFNNLGSMYYALTRVAEVLTDRDIDYSEYYTGTFGGADKKTVKAKKSGGGVE